MEGESSVPSQPAPVGEARPNTSSVESDSKAKRNFQKGWLVTYPWLKYDYEKKLMYCTLCLNIGASNSMTQGTDNFRTSTLTRHLDCDDHKRAMDAPRNKKQMIEARKRAFSKEEEAVFVAMKAVYWLCQESLPINKYPSLITFLKYLNVPNIEHLQIGEKTNYSSQTSAKDLLTAMSDVIDNSISNKTKASPVITLFCDESTDIIVNHKLAINVRVVNPVTLEPNTFFLTDVRIRDATGKGIFDSIKEEFTKRDIKITNVYGLGTDGASVMTGQKTGLTGQFKEHNPHIKNNHCSAHRVALVSQQAAEGIEQINKFQDTVTSIYYFFHKSPKRCDQLEDIQKILDDPVVKYKEVHSVRWLSFYKAVETVYRTLDSLITYFDSLSDDPKAKGMKKKIAQELFISITYGMMDWLKPIMSLSLFFQQKNIDVGVVKVNVMKCIKELENMRNDVVTSDSFSEMIKRDLIDGNFKSHHTVSKNAQHFNTTKTKFLDKMIQGLQDRFPDLETTNQLAVLGMRPLKYFTDEDEINEWGNIEIQKLSDFYTSKQRHTRVDGTIAESEPLLTCTSETVLEEWERCKQIVHSNKYPTSDLASLWGALADLQNSGQLQCPNLIILAALALTHPVHTCDVERTFSVQNLTLTKLRNRMSPELCDKLIRLKIEGGNLETFDFDAALEKWANSKQRRIKL